MKREKTKIIFVEPSESSFEFRKCMALVMESLPPLELIHASDAAKTLELLENDGADVIVVDDELQEELEVILDSIENKDLPVLVQSDVLGSYEANKKLYISRDNIKVIPKEETIDHLHKTLLAATNHIKENTHQKILH